MLGSLAGLGGGHSFHPEEPGADGPVGDPPQPPARSRAAPPLAEAGREAPAGAQQDPTGLRPAWLHTVVERAHSLSARPTLTEGVSAVRVHVDLDFLML